MARAMTDGSAPPQVAPVTVEQFMDSVEDDVRRFHDPGPRAMRRVASAITTPNWSCRPEELLLMARQARRLGIRLHSHLSETFDYVRWAQEVHGCTPLQFAQEHEWLGPDVWFAHMVHLSDDEIGLAARTGTGVAHCPQSNARLGSGIARVPEMLSAGVPVGLAVDGAASNEAADMLSEAHACWLLHRADPRAGSQRGGQPGGHAAALAVEDVVRLGTAGGARVLGLDGVGTLAPGMAADFAVYDLDAPRFFGLHDPAIGPVASGGRPRLRALVCNGRIVVEDDAIPGLDLGALRHDAAALVDTMAF
jgi:cytosine/adenosine deaminase-related metal-dependent hydrolase